MLNFFQKLKQIWPNDSEKLFITKTGILSHLILNEIGAGIDSPLAITVEKEEAIKGIFHELAGFGDPKIISLDLPKREFVKYLEDVEYELLPVICNDTGKRSMDNLKYLYSSMVSGEANGKVFNAMPVVAFKGGIPAEAANYLAGKITFEGKQTKIGQVSSDEAVQKIIEFICDNMSTLKYNIQKAGRKEDGNMRFLAGAEEIIKIIFDTNLDAIIYFPNAFKNMKEGWGIGNDGEVWVDELRDIIIDDAPNIRKILNRRHTGVDNIKMLDEYPLYDDKYYYFTNEYFDSICAKIPYVSRLELKKALKNQKILAGEGGNRAYYTVKVPVITLHGVKIVGRRLRISRKWLDMAGELTWQEKIEIQMKGGIR